MKQTRRKKIIQLLIECDGIQSIDALLQELDVSRATISRDLRALVRDGEVLVLRSAVLLKKYCKPTAGTPNLDKKLAIGRAAAALISADDSVFIGGGSTTLQMLRFLSDHLPMLLVTNSVLHALQARLIDESLRKKLILVGGELVDDRFSLGGKLAREVLASIHVDKVFIGADGISKEAGISDVSTLLAETYRSILQTAEEKTILVDSTKFGKNRHGLVATLPEVNRVITDSHVPRTYVAELRAAGVEVLIAP